MPRAAVELGVVDRVLPLDLIPHAILHALQAGAETLRPQKCPSPN
jgi:chemotaxis response regulator CheB